MRPSGLATVYKIGGSLLQDPASLVALVDALEALVVQRTATEACLLVPGGGPFADAVRTVDRRLTLGNDAAHWMAVLGMDQHAHLLATRVRGARLVETIEEAYDVSSTGGLPVLAPYRWLRSRDPLPHSWSVTSDSIAAWVALEIGAVDLVLVKSTHGAVETVTDGHFPSVLADGVKSGRSLRVRVTDPRLQSACRATNRGVARGEQYWPASPSLPAANATLGQQLELPTASNVQRLTSSL